MNPLLKLAVMATAVVLAVHFVRAEECDSKVILGLNMTDGNSETLTLNVGLTAKRGDDEDNTEFVAEYNYGESEDEATVDNIKANAKRRSELFGDTYGYGDANFLRDEVADIDYRFILGVGLGHYLIRDEITKLAIEFGLAWITEDAGETDNILAFRFGQNLHHELSESARIFESVEFLPEADVWDNYLINAKLGIEADINDRVALRVALEDRYDYTPAEGRDENDLALIAGFSYAL